MYFRSPWSEAFSALTTAIISFLFCLPAQKRNKLVIQATSFWPLPSTMYTIQMYMWHFTQCLRPFSQQMPPVSSLHRQCKSKPIQDLSFGSVIIKVVIYILRQHYVQQWVYKNPVFNYTKITTTEQCLNNITQILTGVYANKCLTHLFFQCTISTRIASTIEITFYLTQRTVV